MLILKGDKYSMAKKLEDLDLKFIERSVEKRRDKLQSDRLKHGKTKKTIEEEALNAYLNEDYWLAFQGAYRLVLFPIVVTAKRLYRKEKQHEKPEDYYYQLESCVEKAYFLSKETKELILEDIKFTLQVGSKKKDKEFEWSIRKIRNESVHIEANWNKLMTEQFDYRRMTLYLINLALRIRNEQNDFEPVEKKQARRFPKAVIHIKELLREA